MSTSTSNFLRFLLPAIALWAVTTSTAFGQNLVTNGDFESTIPGGRHPSIPGWSRNNSGGDSESQFEIPAAACGIAGSQCLDLAAGPPGATVSQTLATTPGQIYVLDYWLDGSVAGSPDSIKVFWDGAEVTGLAVVNSNLSYQHYYASVLAGSSSTVLSFLTAASGNAWYLDNVSVTPGGYTPVITSISSSSGDTAGGNTVTLTGMNFFCVQSVSFGGVLASFSEIDDTTITVTAPAGSAGQANITVTNFDSDNGDSTAYTYIRHAATYTLSGPSSGSLGAASANFTVTPDGSYTGTVTVTPSGGGLSTPVVLTFTNSSAAQTFTITPTSAAAVTLTPSNNGSLTDPSALTYSVLASDFTLSGPGSGNVNAPSANFTVTPNAPFSGTITITPSGGGLSAPVVLTFSNSAAPKTFTVTPLSAGAISLQSSNSGALANPANLTYTANALPVSALAVAPASLVFQYQQGTKFQGATRQLLVSGPVAVASWTAVTDGAPWLSLSTPQGVAGDFESVTAAPDNLAPGTYLSTITVNAPQIGQSVRVPVTLQVLPGAALAVNPAGVMVGAAFGQHDPASASLTISTPGASWSMQQASPAQPWLTLGATAGLAPSTVQLTFDPANLGSGTYSTSLLLMAPGAPNSPLSIPVRFVISTGFNYTAPLENAASLGALANVVSQNEAISLFLPNIACSQTPQLAMNGVAAEVLSFTPGQIDAVLPEALASGPLTVGCQGAILWTFNGLTVVPSVPGIFTMTQTGAGQAAILNQDESANSAENPAPAGSVVSIYATGVGSYLPAAPDGLRRTAAPVTATLGGIPAEIIYAGEAPGMTLGLNQINLRIPPGVSPGAAVPLSITVGEAAAQPGVTIAVR